MLADMHYCKKVFHVLLVIVCVGCAGQRDSKNDPVAGKDSATTADQQPVADTPVRKDTVIRVLVLPAYDEIANAGASPDMQALLGQALSGHDTVKVLPFPWKELMGVPYYMVFDKKYCAPILEKVSIEIIVMSRLITKNEHVPGIWPWDYEVKIYNAITHKQISSIRGKDLAEQDFPGDINRQRNELIADIFATFE